MRLELGCVVVVFVWSVCERVCFCVRWGGEKGVLVVVCLLGRERERLVCERERVCVRARCVCSVCVRESVCESAVRV